MAPLPDLEIRSCVYAETDESALVITGIKGRINRAVWGPLNRTIITAGEDATIRIWDSEVRIACC
jgi:WD40 repeat protein